MTGSKPARRHEGRSRWVIGAGLLIFGIAGTLALYLLADEPVRQRLLESPGTWYWHPWVNALRQLGKAYVPIWLVLLGSCVANRWRPTVVTLTALVLVSLSVCPLKALVPRSRPNAVMAMAHPSVPDPRPLWKSEVSFPSGDTATVFATATALMLSLRRRWGAILFVPAGAVGVLRIITRAHYPSDVFAGAVIGVLAGLWAMDIVVRRWSEPSFRMRGRWRIALAGLLIVVAVASPFLGMRPLWVFLRVYGIPAAGLMLTAALVPRIRGGRTPHAARSSFARLSPSAGPAYGVPAERERE
jgi:membrane-associated phospholipid phosphatase